MRLKIKVLLFFIATIIFGTYAKSEKILEISLKDGSKIECSLASEPKMSFNAKEMVIKTTATSYTVELDKLAGFGFKASPTAINTVPADSLDYEYDYKRILIRNLSEGARTRLFNINGTCVFDKTNTDPLGQMEISIGSFASGVYLLQVNNATVKIVKP